MNPSGVVQAKIPIKDKGFAFASDRNYNKDEIMWEVVFALDETGKPLGKSRFEYCRKNHPQAFAKLKYRVNVIVERLGSGLPPSDALRAGWIHPEKGNVFAIDSLPSTSPFRMYCAIRSHENRIVIFTVGDKKQQQKDLQAVFEWNSQL